MGLSLCDRRNREASPLGINLESGCQLNQDFLYPSHTFEAWI
jgi:hypothetical protein